jgi:YggT family protein
MELLAGVTGIYMAVIFIRVMLTWFSGVRYGQPMAILSRITDPYLDWFRRFSVFRVGAFDLSPIAAMAVLSVAYNVFSILARSGRVTIGLIAGMLILSLWSAVSFFLGFLIIALIVRLIAYLLNMKDSGRFLQVLDAISKPVLYRITRLFFPGRLVHYKVAILAALGLLLAAMIIGGFLVNLAVNIFYKFPF